MTYGTCSAKLPAMKKELVWLKEVNIVGLCRPVGGDLIFDAAVPFLGVGINYLIYTLHLKWVYK